MLFRSELAGNKIVQIQYAMNVPFGHQRDADQRTDSLFDRQRVTEILHLFRILHKENFIMLQQLVETRYCPPRRFAIAALNLLRNYNWPGNLEELQAAVRNVALTALEEEIGVADVERVLREFLPSPAPGLDLPLDRPLREAREAFERAYFEHHLALENGSIARVAEKCGLERTHLYRKLKQLGIPAGRKDEGSS